MTAQATFGIDITASDKTAKGKKAAEKSLGQIPKNIGVINRKAADRLPRVPDTFDNAFQEELHLGHLY